MDSHTFWTIFGGTFALGVIRTVLIRYRSWKANRLLLAAGLRNSGILTDARLRIMELAIVGLVAAWGVSMAAFVVWFVIAAN